MDALSIADEETLSLGGLNRTSTWMSGSDEDQELFVQKWNEALQECRKTLNDSDINAIEQFSSPEELTEDLRRKAEKKEKAYLSKAITDLRPGLKTVKKGLSLLLVSLQPSSIETRLLWGLLYLTIDLSLDTEAKWKQMVGTFTKTTRTLQRCAACTGILNNEEFKDTLLAVFIALIKFWASASAWMRNNPFTKTVDYLSNSFVLTMVEMEDATNTLEHCYSSRLAGKGMYQVLPPQTFTPESSVAGENTIKFPHRDLPQRNAEHFVGRVKIMERIDRYLKPSNSPSTQHMCIWGLGGIGKSQTALEYAYTYAGDFDAMFWVRAETRPSLTQSFLSIAFNLGLTTPSARLSPDEIRDTVHHWLRTCNKRWLMIFDNVEDLDMVSESMPTSVGSILLTTRYSNVAEAARGPHEAKWQLKVLGEDEAWDMFEGMLTGHHKDWPKGGAKEEEVDAGKKLLQRLGGLPLGIRQMAALIRKKRPPMSVERFVTFYDRSAGNSQTLAGGKGFKVASDYPFALETVWALSFEDLYEKQRSGESDAYSLLGIVAFLAPDEIPMDLFKAECPLTKFCGDEDLYRLEPPKDALLDTALIDAEGDDLSVHRLVQTMFLHSMENQPLQDAFDATCTLLNAKFPKQICGRPLVQEWPKCIQYVQHAQNVARRFEDFKGRLKPNDDFVELLSNCAWYLHEIGDWVDCKEVIAIATSACEDKQSLIYSHLQNTLGCCTFELNDLVTCQTSFASALAIRREQLEEGADDLLCTMHNYANLQNGSGKPEEALRLYAEVRGYREKMGKGVKVSLATTYMGTGQALVQLRRFDEARTFYDKSFAIVTEIYGPQGHFVAQILFFYGNLEVGRGDMAAAYQYFERALAIQRSQSPRHLLTACLHYKIGVIQASEGQKDVAIENLAQAFLISKYSKSEENIARIARRMWPLMSQEGSGTPGVPGSRELQHMAEIWERKLSKSDQAIHHVLDKDKAFDNLVCMFFR